MVIDLFKRTKCVKFLGFHVDGHLSWKYHTCELHKKLSRTSGLSFKLGHYIPLTTLVCHHHSLFSSFLNYGIIFWGLTVDSFLNPLFLLQKCSQTYKIATIYCFIKSFISFIENTKTLGFDLFKYLRICL